MMKEFIISQIEDTKKSPPRFPRTIYCSIVCCGQKGGQNNIAHPTWLPEFYHFLHFKSQQKTALPQQDKAVLFRGSSNFR
jgi:hypothetical protein